MFFCLCCQKSQFPYKCCVRSEEKVQYAELSAQLSTQRFQNGRESDCSGDQCLANVILVPSKRNTVVSMRPR